MLQFKLVLLGESAVGKSSLVLRFVKDQFDDYRESTIGGKHAFNAHSNLEGTNPLTWLLASISTRSRFPHTNRQLGRSDYRQV